MLRRIAAASACLLFAVPALRAQNIAEICRHVMTAPTGSWSRFRFEGGRENGATMRMAVVGTESHGDTTYEWLEMEMHGLMTGLGLGTAGDDSMTMISKMLVRGFGPGMVAPRAAIMKFGSLPAMEMPMNGPRMGNQNPGSEALRNCENSKVIGWESVTVPAGTFRALHVQDSQGRDDSWIVPDLPFALVRTGNVRDSSQLVLVAHGSGARSAITETPQPFNPQVFMQLMMQQRGGGGH